MTINCVTRIPWAKYFVTLPKERLNNVLKHKALAARVESLRLCRLLATTLPFAYRSECPQIIDKNLFWYLKVSFF